MRESKLKLIGRELSDINREFQHLLMRIEAGLPSNITHEQEAKIKAAWNSDIDGWINWLESVKK